MTIQIKRIFLCIAALGVIHLSSMAQSTQGVEEEIYFNQEQFLNELEYKTSELINAKNDFLDVATATNQLKEAEGKKATIQKLPIRDKDLQTSELASLVKQSTVVFGSAFDCGKCNRMHIAVASGYVIDEDGIIATNHHVVKMFTESKQGTNIAMPVKTADGNVYLVTEILASHEQGDLCIVRVDTRGDKLKALPLGMPAQQGDPVFVMAHPNDMYFYFTQGVVARNYIGAKDSKRSANLPQMDITADYSAGASGGPIVDIKGNLVSTVSSTHSIYYNQHEQKNLQMVVKKTMPVVLLKNMIIWK